MPQAEARKVYSGSYMEGERRSGPARQCGQGVTAAVLHSPMSLPNPATPAQLGCVAAAEPRSLPTSHLCRHLAPSHAWEGLLRPMGKRLGLQLGSTLPSDRSARLCWVTVMEARSPRCRGSLLVISPMNNTPA